MNHETNNFLGTCLTARFIVLDLSLVRYHDPATQKRAASFLTTFKTKNRSPFVCGSHTYYLFPNLFHAFDAHNYLTP